jgi:hypothetical protein
VPPNFLKIIINGRKMKLRVVTYLQIYVTDTLHQQNTGRKNTSTKSFNQHFGCLDTVRPALTLQRGMTGSARIAKTPYVVE